MAERARPAAEKYYTAELPQGAVLKQISQGTVENLGGNRYRFSYAPYQNVYIAYPKSLFGGNLTKQTFQLHGTYLDTDREVLLERAAGFWKRRRQFGKMISMKARFWNIP